MLKSVCQENSAENTSHSQEVKGPCCPFLMEAMRSIMRLRDMCDRALGNLEGVWMNIISVLCIIYAILKNKTYIKKEIN